MMPPHLQLEFKCFLIDHKTNKHVPVSCQSLFHCTICSALSLLLTEPLLKHYFSLGLSSVERIHKCLSLMAKVTFSAISSEPVVLMGWMNVLC